MRDEEYIFQQDCREKKNIAHSEAKHVRKGYKGKSLGLRQEYMSKYQLNKMNGEMISVNLNAPIDFESFSKLSDESKVTYILPIIKKYSANISDLTKMFKTRRNVVIAELSRLNISVPSQCGRVSHKHQLEWAEFIYPSKSPNQNGDLNSSATPGALVSNLHMTEMTVTYTGKYNADEINNILANFKNSDEMTITINVKTRS